MAVSALLLVIYMEMALRQKNFQVNLVESEFPENKRLLLLLSKLTFYQVQRLTIEMIYVTVSRNLSSLPSPSL